MHAFAQKLRLLWLGALDGIGIGLELYSGQLNKITHSQAWSRYEWDKIYL